MALALRMFTCLVLTVCIVASVDAAISCGTVANTLVPCNTYLTKGGDLPEPCCEGVKKLNDMAQTTPDRQQACKCIKTVSQLINVNATLAAGLPGQCGVNIPYPISRDTDCDKVN